MGLIAVQSMPNVILSVSEGSACCGLFGNKPPYTGGQAEARLSIFDHHASLATRHPEGARVLRATEGSTYAFVSNVVDSRYEGCLKS